MARERVLIADDEIDVLDLCRRILESEGYNVTIAHDGWEALRRARESSFDLLLTDIKMPGLGGLETAQAIKDIDASVICVTMTGYSTMSMAIEALRLGIDEFIVKPFTPDELIASISKALEKVRLRQENIRLRALIPLFELSRVFLSTVDEATILEQVITIAQLETHADGALIFLATPSEGQMLAYHARGILEHVPFSGGHAGWQIPWAVIESSQQLSIPTPTHLDGLYQEEMESAGVEAIIGNPFIAQDSAIGALVVARANGGGPFRASDAEMLGILSGQAGIAISNARLFGEIQHAYEELKKLDHMKGEFINVAAHELRTPLAILMGYASILEEESTGQTRERLEIVVRNAMRLRSLIDDMLNLRYLEKGERLFNPQWIHMEEVAGQVISDLAPLARDKSLGIELELDSDVPAILTDRQNVEIVLTNLVVNAIKFTPPPGRIAISAGVSGQEIVVSVADTGIGIPPEALGKVFEPFYQVEDSLTREHGGIGLGLTIAKGMVERCGGTIWAESMVGRGSRFSFKLPLQPAKMTSPSK